MDEEAAHVVRRIYALCLEGYGPAQIARILKDGGVPVPTAYWLSNGRKPNTGLPDNPYKWAPDTVAYILERREYLGHTVNFKTSKPSYKSKKKLWNPEEKQMVFENTHEAIVDADVWEKVQALRKNKRRPTRTGKTNMFSGVAYCADCGEKLYYCTGKNFEARQDYFVCSNSRKKGKETCATHFIRAVVLEELVLWHLQHVTSFVTAYEELFRMKMTAKRTVERKKQSALLRKQIAQAERRLGELSKLFKRMYEDNVNGKLNDIRFEELSADYEAERADLESKLEQWQAVSKEKEQHAEDVERFIRKCKQYTDISKLTPTILNDLVCKVLVEAPNRSSGKRKQNIHISYDLLGILPELNTSANEEMA